MEINLKQAELFRAIRQYLESQGFHTRGKEVTINVSGGRGTTGAWAAISIEDIDIPGFEADSDDAPIIAMDGDTEDNRIQHGDVVTVSAASLVADPSPATADATPAPVVYSAPADIPFAALEHAASPEAFKDIQQAVVAAAPVVHPVKEEPSLETTDDGLFDLPTAQAPAPESVAAPASPTTPSSLFDE